MGGRGRQTFISSSIHCVTVLLSSYQFLTALLRCAPALQVSITHTIGEGAFGEVSRAEVFPYGAVAIKWLKRDRFAKYSESFQVCTALCVVYARVGLAPMVCCLPCAWSAVQV